MRSIGSKEFLRVGNENRKNRTPGTIFPDSVRCQVYCGASVASITVNRRAASYARRLTMSISIFNYNILTGLRQYIYLSFKPFAEPRHFCFDDA